MKRISIFVLGLLLVSGGGCRTSEPAGGGATSTTASAPSGPAIDTTHVKDIQKGATTKDQARQWFGAPHQVAQVDAIERWTYTWKVGAAGNALVLDFDAQGVVSDFARAADFDASRVQDVQKGVTTKDQARQWFGEPPTIAQEGAVERWTYTGKAGAKTKALVLDFDAQGVVCDQAYVEQ